MEQVRWEKDTSQVEKEEVVVNLNQYTLKNPEPNWLMEGIFLMDYIAGEDYIERSLEEVVVEDAMELKKVSINK